MLSESHASASELVSGASPTDLLPCVTLPATQLLAFDAIGYTPRIVSTGRVALRTTASATLLRNKCANPLRPWASKTLSFRDECYFSVQPVIAASTCNDRLEDL